MARRLASVGYYVMLPNLYYRSNVLELGPFVGEAAAAVREKIMALMGSLTIAMVMDDTDALIAFASTDKAASAGADGMRRLLHEWTLRTERRGAASRSRRGGGLAVRHGPDHRAARQSTPCGAADKGRILYRLRRKSITTHRVETVAPLPRGPRQRRGRNFMPASSMVSHSPSGQPMTKAAAERHWERLFALFARRLTVTA